MLVEVKENYSVKNLTSFKVGGNLSKLYFPKTQQEFIYLLKTLHSPMVIGNWSNVIVSSNGIDGNMISTTKLNNIDFKGNRVTVDAGVKVPLLSQSALEKSLSGFEFLIGIPGTIGGNIYMNASAHAQAISDTLVSVCVFDMDKKEVVVLDKKVLDFAYRSSLLQRKPYILLSAEFELKKAEKNQVQTLMDRNLDFRRSHQPSLALPNAGSIFKNPENDSAGRLLDKAGVKSFSVGGAKIWENHANFIINSDNATSEDILELMYKMYNAVNEKYTIKLKPEVKFLGKMSEREEIICSILYNQK